MCCLSIFQYWWLREVEKLAMKFPSKFSIKANGHGHELRLKLSENVSLTESGDTLRALASFAGASLRHELFLASKICA